ncbi:hypothetical protein SAMN05660199_01379 [Klenkia soli]|uniref:GNAT family N-acetyltransferase n=1 Tax=Klenkia soli TaxID=1052260 RepID=A0A1H0H8U4_9ACTN|nr:hypothetical protein [Klenkia soli]SDO15474.1 hypothetical protein SAMN05660199_01379 [Klenkia soli]
MLTRVVEGPRRVVREIRAAAPLLRELAAPTTVRGPWLAAALHAAPAPVPRVRHRAVVVEAHRQGRPAGLALLSSRVEVRRGRPVTVFRLLGDPGPAGPPGVAPRRLPVADPDVAVHLADGVADLLATTRGRWQLHLTGLPLGDPVLAALGARLGTGAVFQTSRSRSLVDSLDTVGPVLRSTRPADLERWLPTFLDHRPAGARRADLRALARVHAAAGSLEHAVVLDGGRPRAGLLTVLDGASRRPWWGFGQPGGAATAPGQPWVALAASGRGRQSSS